MAGTVHLLDVNVLCALMHEGHIHHRLVRKWFDRQPGPQWALCPITEAGFVRVSTNPKNEAMRLTFDDAAEMLASLERHGGYHFWPVADTWNRLTAPIAGRIFGYRQVTDAVLLGMAIQRNGSVATLDSGFRHLAGPDFEKRVVLLG
jgi:uncharacterized protein